MPETQPSGPVLDVMVPSHNHLELTIRCLNKLYEFTHTPFHLIICDDSTDLTTLWLRQFCKEHDNVTYIHSDVPYKCGNQFFNRALASCKTPFMATIMNSVEVQPEWEIGLLSLMTADPKVGVIGMKCLLPDGSIESSRIHMNKWLPLDVGRGMPGHMLSLIYETEAVQWAAALVRVEAIKGILSEDVPFGFRGWDDIDNCFCVKKAGWKVLACGSAVAIHTPRATRGDNGKAAEMENHANGAWFYKRWGLWEQFIKEHPSAVNIHTHPTKPLEACACPLCAHARTG